MDLRFVSNVRVDESIADDENATIWRYMPFPQFCAMVSGHAVFFSRATNFADPWEGSYPRSFLDPLRWEPFLARYNQQASEWNLDIAQLSRHLVRALKSTARRRHYFVSCWHEREDESEPFWRLYSDPRFGVAVRSSIGRLCAALQEGGAIVARVRYSDLGDPSATVDEASFIPILHKRSDFAHEKEVRAVIHRIEPLEASVRGINVEANLEELVDRVVVSPFAEDWFVDVVRHFCAQAGLSCEPQRSTLYEAPHDPVEEPDISRTQDSVRKWALFPSIDAFNAWHAKECEAWGLPRFSVNAATGVVALTGGLTIAAASPYAHPNDGRVTASILVPPTDDTGLAIVDHDWLLSEGWFAEEFSG